MRNTKNSSSKPANTSGLESKLFAKLDAVSSTITSRLWQELISVRLMIALLVLLTVFCVLGTLIGQQGMTQKPLEQMYTATQLKWLVFFGLTDVFHSGYFIFLLMMLALNLIACSYERLPKIWKLTFHTPAPPTKDPFMRDWSPQALKSAKLIVQRYPVTPFKTANEARLATQIFLEKKFGHSLLIADNGNEFQQMVEKGKYTRTGVYVLHLALLMIMFGGVLGAVFGLEGGMSIEEGTRQSWLQHSKGTGRGYNLFKENGVPVKGFLDLGFDVECVRFDLETYDGSRPKTFRSKLRFFENDVLVHTADISVNNPTEYKGLTFYQASYQELGPGAVDMQVVRGEGKAAGDVDELKRVRIGDLYRIDGDAAFKVTNIEANMMNLGQAVRIEYYKSRADKNPKNFWIFKNLPGFDFAHRKTDAHHFVLQELKPKFATGLAVARDPGVWVVWIGSAILIAALFMALYAFHSRYWIAYSKEDGFVVVGWSNKLFLFENKFETFIEEFRKEMKLETGK